MNNLTHKLLLSKLKYELDNAIAWLEGTMVSEDSLQTNVSNIFEVLEVMKKDLAICHNSLIYFCCSILNQNFGYKLSDIQKRMMETLERKNKGYSSIGDPLENFRWQPIIGTITRMSDKACRMKNLLEKDIDPLEDESFEDTVWDMLGYSLLSIAIQEYCV